MQAFILSSLITMFALPLITLAEVKYTPLVRVPGVTDGVTGNFGEYVNFLYALSISVAALIAVIKIIIAGMKYMLTDVVTTKGDAKKDIQGALFGLLLIIGAFIVLETINPQILRGSLNFDNLPADPTTLNRPPVVPVKVDAPSVPQAFSVPGLDPCIEQKITNGIFMYNTLSCTKELNLFAERDKAKAHCEGALRGKFIDYGTTFGCTPAINMFDSNNAPSGGGAPPAKTATDETEVYTCIKGAGTRKQGTVTYQIFDLSTCKNESASKSYLSSKICSPNAVLNLGSGKFYCKQ